VNEVMAALSVEVEAAEENEVAEAAEAEIDAVNDAMLVVSQEVIAAAEEEEVAEAEIERAGEEGAEGAEGGVEEDIAGMIVNEATTEEVVAEQESAEVEGLEPFEALPDDNVVEAEEANDDEPEREEEAAVGIEEEVEVGVEPEELDVEEDSSRLEDEVESGGTEYPAEEEGGAMLPVQGQVEIFEVNAVSKVPPSPRVLVRTSCIHVVYHWAWG